MNPAVFEKSVSDILFDLRKDFDINALSKKDLVKMAINTNNAVLCIKAAGTPEKMATEVSIVVIYEDVRYFAKISPDIIFNLFGYTAGTVLAMYDSKERVRVVKLAQAQSIVFFLDCYAQGKDQYSSDMIHEAFLEFMRITGN